jgi:hypothetical protein
MKNLETSQNSLGIRNRLKIKDQLSLIPEWRLIDCVVGVPPWRGCLRHLAAS